MYVDEYILYTAYVQYPKKTGVVGAARTRLQNAVHFHVGAGNGPMSSQQQQVLLTIELSFYTGICEYTVFIAAYKIPLFISILFHISLQW